MDARLPHAFSHESVSASVGLDYEAAHARLDAYSESHPNLVALWKKRLVERLIRLQNTITRVEMLTGDGVETLQTQPDLSIRMISMLHILFRRGSRDSLPFSLNNG